MFDAEYDEENQHFNDLKAELAEQAKLNKSVFEVDFSSFPFMYF